MKFVLSDFKPPELRQKVREQLEADSSVCIEGRFKSGNSFTMNLGPMINGKTPVRVVFSESPSWEEVDTAEALFGYLAGGRLENWGPIRNQGDAEEFARRLRATTGGGWGNGPR